MLVVSGLGRSHMAVSQFVLRLEKTGLFDRITEMEAMELKKVTQEQIEEISVDYDEKIEKHRDIMAAARAASGLEGVYEDSAEQAELMALEREILAEAGVADDPVDETPTTETEPVRETPEPVKIEAHAEGAEVGQPARRPLDEELDSLASEQEEPEEPALELE